MDWNDEGVQVEGMRARVSSAEHRPDMSRDSVRGRTVGKAATGKIYKGRLQSPDVRTMSSIPAKFETILNTADKPASAFWTSSPRSFGALDLDMPGPGTYRAPSSLHLQSDSFSKKGFGGMTSQTTRFPGTAGRKAGARRKQPGPGAYDLQGKVPHAQRDFNRAAHTSAFAKMERPAEPALAERAQFPGPGTYAISEASALLFHSEKPTMMPFKSGVDRFSAQFAAVTPSPGAYETATAFPGGTSEVTSAAFRNSGRYGGPTARRTHASAADAAASVALKELHKNEVSDLYHAVEVDGFGRRLPAGASHSFFAPTETDRFGEPLSPRHKRVPVPGPGAYDAALPGSRGRVGLRSSFVSRGPRILEDVKTQTALPPGPAFYAPEIIGKQSHRKTGAAWGV